MMSESQKRPRFSPLNSGGDEMLPGTQWLARFGPDQATWPSRNCGIF